MVTPETLLEIAKREASNPEEIELKHIIDEHGIPSYSIVDYVVSRSFGDPSVEGNCYPLVIGFQVFEVVGYNDDKTQLEWQEADARSHPEGTTDLAKAERYLEAHVKWDGCSYWQFDAGFHFCDGREGEYKRFRDLMDTIMERAHAALPTAAWK